MLSDGGVTASVDTHSTAVMENKHSNETTIHNMLYRCVTTVTIGMKLLQLPIRCHTSPMVALLNSGASHNFISSAVLKLIGAHKLWAKVLPMQVKVANKDIMILDKVACLWICFAPGLGMNIKFRVVPHLNHQFILGM